MEELVPFNVRTVQWVDFNLTTKMLTWHYYGVLCFLKIVCTWTSETSDNLEACSEKNLKEGWVRFDKERGISLPYVPWFLKTQNMTLEFCPH